MAARRGFANLFSNGARYCSSKPGISASSSKWGNSMQNLLKNQSTRQWSSRNRMLAALVSERTSHHLACINFEPSIAITTTFKSPPNVISAGDAECESIEAAAESTDSDIFSNEEEALSGTIMSIFNVTRYRADKWKRCH